MYWFRCLVFRVIFVIKQLKTIFNPNTMTSIKIFICTFFTVLFFTARSQGYAAIDERARSIPFPKDRNIRNLALTLSEGCTTEKEKVRAYFVWICENIKYDIKTFENGKEMDPEKRKALNDPENVLKNRKGVCEGYSNLFVALCGEVNIKALKVAGLSKNTAGKVSRGGHAWCMVRTDGQWGLTDPTWGAGDVDLDAGKYEKRFKERYFLSTPEAMILEHYPLDPLFQMLPNPLTLEEFKQNDIKSTLAQKQSGKPRAGFDNITDSINVFVSLDSTEMLNRAGTRILSVEPNSNVGLYNVGMYHFRLASQHLDAYKNQLIDLQSSRKPITAAWCDQQIAHLDSAKSKFQKSMEITDRSTVNDTYSAGIKMLRRNTQNMLEFVENSTNNLKKSRSRAH